MKSAVKTFELLSRECSDRELSSLLNVLAIPPTYERRSVALAGSNNNRCLTCLQGFLFWSTADMYIYCIYDACTNHNFYDS